jgi:hypothetical protein
MLEVLSRSLGFVSASLVALIALGFGLMFVFFSGSRADLGHFLRFVREARVGLRAVLLAAAAAGLFTASLENGMDVPQRLALPGLQLVCGLVAWALVRATRLHRALAWLLGAILLVCGGLFVFGLVAPTWDETGHAAVLVAAIC